MIAVACLSYLCTTKLMLDVDSRYMKWSPATVIAASMYGLPSPGASARWPMWT